MKNGDKIVIKVYTLVSAPLEKVWKYWTEPEHIIKWNYASADWYTPRAENDLCRGGRFSFRMEARDGSFGFDFRGVYSQVDPHRYITYVLDDGRMVEVFFNENESGTEVSEYFEAEGTNSHEMQRTGWQAILDNFKLHSETN